MEISANVLEAARFPAFDLFVPPPLHPMSIVRRDGFAVMTLHGLTFGFVTVRSLAGQDLWEVVAEARELLRAAGVRQGAWEVPEAATRGNVVERLGGEFGMVPYDEPPLEPRHAALVLVHPPEPGPPEVEARLAESVDELRAALAVTSGAFHMSDEDTRAMGAQQEAMWELEQDHGQFRSFVALLDGEIVGTGTTMSGENAVFLSGGSTREDVRGRGVYRALVRARWDDAVARGTPALTVGAESMSRPILERPGFEHVGWADVLVDRHV